MCRRYKAHRHKLVLILSGMRSKRDSLRKAGHSVFYRELGEDECRSYESILDTHLCKHRYEQLAHFETDSPRMDRLLRRQSAKHGLTLVPVQSPKFMTTSSEFESFRTGRRLFMADFYRWQRRRLGVLVDDEGAPQGGRWSFDEDNRKKLPRDLIPPAVPRPPWTDHTKTVVDLVDEQFSEHPGLAREFWLPTTPKQAEVALDSFLGERFEFFGDYEDALSKDHGTIFHSILSPLLNVGLLTPECVLDRALEQARRSDVPLNALEGFVRQIIGWREFVRGAWRSLPASHWEQNFWGHRRRLTSHWYEGTTGLPPLDDVIRRARSTGYNHHIERLMVVGNLMLLCQIEPGAAYDWFMEMYVDSADWVMAPNVYGMALFSEGGAFTTKPYICGSNYLRKMSDYPRGEWCNIIDGLYWSFVEEHRDFFEKNPRSKMMLGTLDRIDPGRKRRIFARARYFVDRVTA